MMLLYKVESWILRNVAIWVQKNINGVQPISHTNPKKLRVLHKSEHYLAVNKHPDLLFNTDDKTRFSLFDQIKECYPEHFNPNLGHGFYVLHRLDFSTSGVVVIPLSKEATAKGTKEFEQRRTKKYYLALVRGHVAQSRLDINLPIGKDTREEWLNVKMCTPRQDWCKFPRQARTRLVVLEKGLYNSYPATKVLLSPVTGRRHQLRVHCHEVGHTIVGDFTYSNRRDLMPHRMFLHAHRLMMSTKLEVLDVNAGDPFTEMEPLNKWTVTESLLSLQDGYSQIDGPDGWTKID